MSLIPMDLAHITLALQNDCQQMRTNIYWAKQRYQTLHTMLTPTVMTAAGISAADQTAITQFINDLGRLIIFMNGTLPAQAFDIDADAAAIIGVM